MTIDDYPIWYSKNSKQMFDTKYATFPNETPYQRFKTIAKTAASHLRGTKYEKANAEDKFFNLMWNGWLSPSTPVLSNMGTDRGLPVSCSGGIISDSISGFYSSLHEVAMLTKTGFGTSGYLSDIRPRGSLIRTGGKANGVLPVYKMFVQAMRDVSQGSTRRGSFAGYLHITHGDFYEIADFIQSEVDDCNIGWIITDQFIEELNSGSKDAINRYQRALKLKMVTGRGYFWFIDKANRKSPVMYKDRNLKIKGSNLCLSGDTLVQVKYFTEDSTVVTTFLKHVINSKNPVFIKSYNIETKTIEYKEIIAGACTAQNAKVVRVNDYSKNQSIICTPDHEIYTINRGYVKACDLQSDDKLLSASPCQSFKTKFISVDYLNYTLDVYDITVKDNNNFFANNLLVHNCSEISLFSDEDHTFTCVLSSMNIAKYDEWKDTDAVYWSTIFLDTVAQEFIEKGKNYPGLEKAIRFTEKSRALGLGQLGFHSYLQKKRIPFESLEAHLLSNTIASAIWNSAEEASRDMAIELGEPELCVNYGKRNTHLIAIAPNKSTSVLMGDVSESVSPEMSFVSSKLTAAGEMFYVSPELEQIMIERNVFTKENIQSIASAQGSVQHVNFLSNEEKLVFKTAFEIDQNVLLRLASARTKWIDQAASLNLFFSSESSEEEISIIHQKAFLDENILSLYYVYSRAVVNTLTQQPTCLACEG